MRTPLAPSLAECSLTRSMILHASTISPRTRRCPPPRLPAPSSRQPFLRQEAEDRADASMSERDEHAGSLNQTQSSNATAGGFRHGCRQAVPGAYPREAIRYGDRQGVDSAVSSDTGRKLHGERFAGRRLPQKDLGFSDRAVHSRLTGGLGESCRGLRENGVCRALVLKSTGSQQKG